MDRFEIRIFNERFNMNPVYYEGNEDVSRRGFANDEDSLIKIWSIFLEEEEGETYAIWDHKNNKVITGGALDPGDMEYIKDYFK